MAGTLSAALVDIDGKIASDVAVGAPAVVEMPASTGPQREGYQRKGVLYTMIPGFPQVGGIELIIVLVVILLFFGAKRIPELARSLGKGANEFRKGISEGASEDETQEEDRKDKEQENPPLRQAAESKPSQTKTETIRTE